MHQVRSKVKPNEKKSPCFGGILYKPAAVMGSGLP